MVKVEQHSADDTVEDVVDKQWVLDAAYSGSKTVTAVANELRIPRRRVRDAHTSVAGVWLERTRARLSAIGRAFTQPETVLHIFLDRLVWDETNQDITLDLIGLDFDGDSTKSSWQIMVMRRHFVWRVLCAKDARV